MKGRELGSMYIENDVIQILETDPKETEDERKAFFMIVAPAIKYYAYDARIVTEWWALVDELPVGYACLTERGKEEVQFFVVVTDERRGVGLGKLMIRFATDQAIRHRKRMIVAIVKNDNRAYSVLEDEGFEPVEPGLLRKELKWQ